MFGYDSKDGKLVPNENAETVRIIFRMFLEGKTLTEIADALCAQEVAGRNGVPLTVNGILYILGNETYVGDKLLQKRAPKNFLTKQPDKNVEFESSYLMDDHEGIIDRETWDAVQARLKQRREELDQGEKGYHGGRTHFLYGTLMTRRTLRCSSKPDIKATYKAWT